MFSLVVILVVLGGNLRRGSAFMEVLWWMGLLVVLVGVVLALLSLGLVFRSFRVGVDGVVWVLLLLLLARLGEPRGLCFEFSTHSFSRRNWRSSSE